MSETTATPVTSSVAPLTVQDVISPRVFGAGVLEQALAAKAKSANEQLVLFAGSVLNTAQAVTTQLAQQKVELEAALKKVSNDLAKINEAASYTQSSNNVFALAAAVGKKGEAINFARSAGLLVPANDDCVWSVPKAQ